MTHEYTCPKCKGHRFEISARMAVQATVAFTRDGDHDLEDYSDGDIEWGPDDFAECKSCGHTDRLGKFEP